MNAGDKVSWRTLNGRASGTLVSIASSQLWLVKMNNGRDMLVHESSMIPDDDAELAIPAPVPTAMFHDNFI